MAWDHDRDRIASVGRAHGTHGIGRSDREGLLGIRTGFAIGNLLQGPPDADLEWRALQDQRQIEVAKIVGEVGIELARGLTENRMVVATDGSGRKPRVEPNLLQTLVDGDEGEDSSGDAETKNSSTSHRSSGWRAALIRKVSPKKIRRSCAARIRLAI